MLCLWWLSRVRVRGHARAPACVIPCSSGVVGLVEYHRLCVQTVVACSRSCRRVGVGVSSGSCLAVSARHLGLSGASSLALVCSLCSLGRASWCGRSWVGIDVVCTRPHPSPAIARVSGGSGAASVLSWCRVSRACQRCVGYARAARCGPLVASRPPKDLKNETNPHQVTLGRPPVTFGLRGAGFQSRFQIHSRKVDVIFFQLGDRRQR